MYYRYIVPVQVKKEVSSIEKRDDKVSTTIKEDFALKRLEDFLAGEQERLQNFLFEESSVLAAHESGQVGGQEGEGEEEILGEGVGVQGLRRDGEISLLQDATPVQESEMEKIVKTSHLLLGQNNELQANEEVEKVFDEEKEKETIEKLGLTRKSVGNSDNSQVELLAQGTFAQTPQLGSRRNEQNQGIGSERKNEDNWSVGEKQKKKQLDKDGYNTQNPVVDRNDTRGASLKLSMLEKPDFHPSDKLGEAKADEAGMKEGEYQQKQMEGDEQGNNQDLDQDHEHKDEQKEGDEHEQMEGDEDEHGQEVSSIIEARKEGEGGDRLRIVSDECKKEQKFLIKVNHLHNHPHHHLQ